MEHCTCPNCGTRIDFVQAVEDECARAFMALLKRSGQAAPHLVGYVMLFKPRIQGLRWSRALALGQDIEELIQSHGEAVVARALMETVASMQAKQGPAWKPLKNHNYLRSVIDTVSSSPPLPQGEGRGEGAPKGSKTAQAIAALESHPGPGGEVDPRFAKLICAGLSGWLLLGLEGQPAADLVTAVADDWIAYLWPKRDWNDTSKGYVRGLRLAFEQVGANAKRWPSKSEVLACVPKFG